MKKINFLEKFSKFNELWSPKVIAEMNDYQFKLAKIKNDFIWHSHEKTDEAFIVIKGSMSIEFKNETIKLNEGEMIVLPKEKKHRPFADEEAKIMLIEPRGTSNTGDIVSDLTSENDQWI